MQFGTQQFNSFALQTAVNVTGIGIPTGLTNIELRFCLPQVAGDDFGINRDNVVSPFSVFFTVIDN